jgi:hypothetical protein
VSSILILYLVTYVLSSQLPDGFNQLKHPHDTEQMIQFHLAAGSWQLQQAYWGILAAVALKRVYVLPGFHCFCARNW